METTLKDAATRGKTSVKPLIFPISQFPHWRRDPRAITFLKACNRRQMATKQWIGNSTEPIDYDRVKNWRAFAALANNIDELGLVLARAEDLPTVLAVRASVRLASISKEMINRRYRSDGDEQPDLEDTPRQWLMIDLDKKPEPTHFNWLDNPHRAALWAVEEYLPSAWRDTRFYYQYSGSAGVRPGLRLHIWYWLDRPYSSLELKKHFIQLYGRDRFDLSVFNPCQPHYTAAPVFKDREDPLKGRRHGFGGGLQ